tara:strand:+ start:4984 stop:6834 length:1851 start_codon:yes stop_codon:yes gene_type:complete
VALINTQTQKPKINVTNIKSPIGKLSAAPISKIGRPTLKVTKPTIKPLDLNIDTKQTETNVGIFDNIIGLEKKTEHVESRIQNIETKVQVNEDLLLNSIRTKQEESLTEVNKTLVEIQGIITKDFASRLKKEQNDVKKIRTQSDKDKKAGAESGVEKATKFSSTITKQFDKVVAPAKSIFSKFLSFLGVVATGFVVTPVLKWLRKSENLDKVTGIFNFLSDNAGYVIALLSGAVIFKVINKVQKIFRALRNLSRFFRGQPQLMNPRGGLPTGGGTSSVGQSWSGKYGTKITRTGTRTIGGTSRYGKALQQGGTPLTHGSGASRTVSTFKRTKSPLSKAMQTVNVGAKNVGRNLFKSVSKAGTKFLGKGIMKFLRPILKKIPVVGVLLDFGISVALGENPGRAAFGAIGAGLLGAIGTMIGGPVGMFLGGFAGDWAGRKLYDVFFKKMEKGGTVPGPKINKDITPILGTPGEKVVNLKQSKQFGPLIDDINFNGGSIVNTMLSSLKEQDSNNASFAAANTKLASLISGVQETSTTPQKDIKTTIPISTPDIAKKNLEKPSKGGSETITLPTIKQNAGGGQDSSDPQGPVPSPGIISAEDESNTYLSYTMQGLGIYQV